MIRLLSVEMAFVVLKATLSPFLWLVIFTGLLKHVFSMPTP